MKNFKNYINSHSDFPQKGIIFRDTLKILQYPKVFNELIFEMGNTEIIKNADAILAIDARGFIFGSAISSKVSKPMVVARKGRKLPGKLISKEYELEYGKDKLSIQSNAIASFNSFAIVDDLIATGGTINSVVQILESKKKTITGIVVMVDVGKKIRQLNIQQPIWSNVNFD